MADISVLYEHGELPVSVYSVHVLILLFLEDV